MREDELEREENERRLQEARAKFEGVFKLMISNEQFEQRYSNQKKIGFGTGANVYEVFDEQNKAKRAIKVYKSKYIDQCSFIDVLREVECLQFLRQQC
jgi:hypothetical protein